MPHFGQQNGCAVFGATIRPRTVTAASRLEVEVAADRARRHLEPDRDHAGVRVETRRAPSRRSCFRVAAARLRRGQKTANCSKRHAVVVFGGRPLRQIPRAPSTTEAARSPAARSRLTAPLSANQEVPAGLAVQQLEEASVRAPRPVPARHARHPRSTPRLA